MLQVSIHTPTKGVTLQPLRGLRTRRSFNPHTHEGCDLQHLRIRLPPTCFNPHTHEGCDIRGIGYYPQVERFNPHTHEGCDGNILILKVKSKVSIHTPTKGVTFFGIPKCVTFVVSIHTPTKGVTCSGSSCRSCNMFQSTHPRRV